MIATQRQAILIGGAKGSGKTTFARQFVPAVYPLARYLNVDEIQRLEPSLAHPLAAGREVFRRLSNCEAERESFAIESSLATKMYARRIPRWPAIGFRVKLHFLEAPSADFCVARVERRVAQGGHDVPETDVRRRYLTGLHQFHEKYRRLVHIWRGASTGVELVRTSAPEAGHGA